MFFFLPHTNPHINLATEEWLLERVETIGPTLLAYINSKCVVMGKHQNPLLETRPDVLRANSIPLLRRFTGGGTVYHDTGNLNFSFLMPKQVYDEKLHFKIVQNALASFEIESTIDPHKSLWHQNLKFSGSAFARKLVGNIHHGTLLVNSDLNTLCDALLPAEQNLPTKAPRSRRAPVVNLATLSPALTIPKLVESLYNEFETHFAQHAARSKPFWKEDDLAPFVHKHHSHAWVFGNTPEY